MNDPMFALHPQLAADTHRVLPLALCELLLIDDCRYLWCVLVPRVTGLRDLHDVPLKHKAQLIAEMDQVSQVVKHTADAHKMNVAALGNMVEQLHIHVVARHRDDEAWPGPIWGVGEMRRYTPEAASAQITTLREQLAQKQ